MQLSLERRSFLSGEHRQLGWIEIPSTAPLHIQNRIVEWRHSNIEKASKPNKQAAGTEARRKRADAILATIAQEEKEENFRRLKLRYTSLFL